MKVNKADGQKAARLRSALNDLGAEHLLNAAIRDARHAFLEGDEFFAEVRRDVKGLIEELNAWVGEGVEGDIHVYAYASSSERRRIDLGDPVGHHFDLRAMLIEARDIDGLAAFLRSVADELDSKP